MEAASTSGRRVHQDKDLGGEQAAKNHDQHSGGNAKGQRRMDGQLHPLFILRPEVAVDDHARTSEDAAKKADQHKDQAAGGADGGQRLIAQQIADDQGIGDIVGLLKQVAPRSRGRANLMIFFSDWALGDAGWMTLALPSDSPFPKFRLYICSKGGPLQRSPLSISFAKPNRRV